MKITKSQLKQIIKEELDESWERYEFDDQGEHTATRRSDRSREQRRWDKMKQAKAARDRWQQEDPEAYEAHAAEKAREREEWLARQRDPELNRQIMIDVIKDLIRNGTPPGALMSKPGIVKAALDSLGQEQASGAAPAAPPDDTPEP